MDGSQNLVEAAEKIAIASIYAKLGKRGRAYLDSRHTDDLSSFLDALQGFHAAEGGFPKEDSPFKKPKQQLSLTCFNCGKSGHKAAECWSNSKPQNQSRQQQIQAPPPSTTVSCFLCGKQGHKSTACPENANKNKNALQKKQSVKRASTPDTRFNTCDGSVDGTSMSFTLDTSAMISVIPEEFVSNTAEKCGEVLVTDANGGTRIKQKVRVNVVIGNQSFNREVALAPKAEVGEKGLFALNLCDKQDVKVIHNFVNDNAPLETKAVLTRAAKVKEDDKNKLDEIAERERDKEIANDKHLAWEDPDDFFKSKFSNVTILCVPSHTDTFILHTDASSLGVGEVLSIQQKGKEIPTAFFSRQLRGAERNYSTTEWEALAIVTAIHHFLPLLYGNRFTVVTDHKPLTSLMTSRTLNKRLHGWALKLAEFDFQIVYRSGDLNGNADGLSRQAWSRNEAPDYLSQCSSVAEASNVLSGGECGVWRRPRE